MRRHRRLAERPGDPLAGDARVGEGFLGSEGLGADDEQRVARIRRRQQVHQRTAIDIRRKMDGRDTLTG
jgi:hypothetical protein